MSEEENKTPESEIPGAEHVPDVTPETPAEEVKEHTPDPLAEKVDRLEHAVSELADKVTSALTPVVAEAPEVKDENPIRKPWTHRWIR